jgi:hypothetical protein
MKKRISIVLVLVLGMVVEIAKADFTFGEPTNLGPTVNSSHDDFGTNIPPDGLSLYFGSDRPGGSGGYDLWVTTRSKRRPILGDHPSIWGRRSIVRLGIVARASQQTVSRFSSSPTGPEESAIRIYG